MSCSAYLYGIDVLVSSLLCVRLNGLGYPRQTTSEGSGMAVGRSRRGGARGGLGLGGILVIVGIIVAIVWSLVIGIIIALIGLIAFGGFARGKWY